MKRRAAEIARELADEMEQAQVVDLLARLENHPVPEPGREETQTLIASLRPLIPKPARRRFRAEGLQPKPVLAMLQQLTAQARQFRLVWWLTTFAAVACGLFAAPLLAQYGIPVSVLAPLLVIGGVVYSFRHLSGGALEIELSCPITPAQLILSRVLVMLGYYLVLGLFLAPWIGGPVGTWALTWVSALFFFTGLMLTLTLAMGAAPAAIYALLLWGALILIRDEFYSLFMPATRPGWAAVQVTALVAGLCLSLLSLRSTTFHRLIARGER